MSSSSSAVLLAAALLAGCSALPADEDCTPAIASRLYLGRSSPAGEVSDAAWLAFLADAVTPRLPEGYTVFDARGHWRDTAGPVRENSFVLEVLRPPGTDGSLRAIAADYARRFDQQAVLLSEVPVRSCLIKR